MPGDPIVIVFMLVIGLAAFLFFILYLFGRTLGIIGRGFLNLVRGGRPGNRAQRGREGGRLICSRDQCRQIEYRNGQYCSRCGAPLRPLSAKARRDL
jgi:hypothetical protein